MVTARSRRAWPPCGHWPACGPRWRPEEPDAPDVAAPKGEGDGPASIRITREGDIVTASEEADTRSSTLSSIMAPMAAPEKAAGLAEDTPEESSAKRRKRRPVEGPDEIAAALMREALSICGTVAGARIESAVLGQTRAKETDLRRAAWRALRARCAESETCAEARDAAETAFFEDDPVIRLAAFDVLGAGGVCESQLGRALSDPDALIRAAALEQVPPETALQHLGDDANPVRRAALRRILADGQAALRHSALDRLVAAERADTLAELLRTCSETRARALAGLAADSHAPRPAFIILDALSRTDGGGAAQDVTA